MCESWARDQIELITELYRADFLQILKRKMC